MELSEYSEQCCFQKSQLFNKNLSNSWINRMNQFNPVGLFLQENELSVS